MRNFIALFFTVALFYSFSTVEAISIEYPNNLSKAFQDENGFYDSLNKNTYKEYENATYSYREKLRFNDWPEALNVFNLKTNRCSEKASRGHTPHIDPDRQVYFFASFIQNATEEFHKFIVIDAETSQVLAGGNTFTKYENPYNH